MEIPKTFHLLEGFHLPDEFWPAFGYDTDSAPRFVSIYWTPWGDEAEVDDGRFAGTMDPWAYLTLVNHPRNLGLTREFEFGNSDFEAEHRLLIDLEENRVYAGDEREVAQFVHDQWVSVGGSEYATGTVELDEEGWRRLQEAVSAAFTLVQGPSPEELAQAMERGRQNLAALQEAMDRD